VSTEIGANAATPAAPMTALRAAAIVVDLPEGPERRLLWSGHRLRRTERVGKFGNETDFTAADAWLVEEIVKRGLS